MARPKKYKTEEERITAKKEYNKRWYQENLEREKEKHKRYYHENREKVIEQHKEYLKEYIKTPIGRAVRLVSNYQQEDKKRNRGECTLTAQWIIDNIFTSKCRWCGETDWTKLGCDRIDNDLPHTPDNVIPCCTECNKKRGTTDYETFKNTFINNNITN